jgi:RHS repeat-associated protein
LLSFLISVPADELHGIERDLAWRGSRMSRDIRVSGFPLASDLRRLRPTLVHLLNVTVAITLVLSAVGPASDVSAANGNHAQAQQVNSANAGAVTTTAMHTMTAAQPVTDTATSRLGQQTKLVQLYLPLVMRSGPVASVAPPTNTTTTLLHNPTMFIENVGQVSLPAGLAEPDRPRFIVQGAGTAFYLSPDALWLTLLKAVVEKGANANPIGGPRDITNTLVPLDGVNLRLSFVGANPQPQMVGTGPLGTHISYFVGHGPSNWHVDVPAWGAVTYRELYPGVDLELTSQQGQLALSWIVRPGAQLDAIRLRVDGADRLSLSGNTLMMQTALGTLGLPLPRLVGDVAAANPPKIAGNDVLAPFAPAGLGGTTPPPSLPDDSSALIYSGFLGGSGDDQGRAIAVDSAGAAYVTGIVTSTNFITTTGSFSPTYGGGSADVFVTKILPDGSGLAYSTYLGGSGADYGEGIAVDSSGAAYVTGDTNSTNFPAQSAYSSTLAGGYDAFVTKLSISGDAVAYSTYLGGSSDDYGRGIAVDGSGAAYVTGSTYSSNFPTQSAYSNTLSGGEDVFVTKLTSSGSALAFSTYLGGAFDEYGYAIAVNASGEAYVTGSAFAGFPTTAGAYHASCVCSYGGLNGFITQFSSSGASLLYSSYFGPDNQEVYGEAIAVGSDGTAYVTGYTTAIPCFDCKPTSAPTSPSDTDPSGAFVLKFDPTQSGAASRMYARVLPAYEALGIAVDSSGAAYVDGWTATSYTGTVGAFDTSYNGGYGDAFVAKIKPDGTGLAYWTFLGSSGFDIGTGLALGNTDEVYVTGYTTSTTFPMTAGSFNTTYQGGAHDAFVAKLHTVVQPDLPPSQAFATNECPFCDNRSRVYIAGRGINVYSGNFNQQAQNGAILGGLGYPLSFEPSYNSLATGINSSYTVSYTSVLGYGWTHDFNVNLVLTPTGEPTGTVMLIAPRGSQLRFADQGSGSYSAHAGVPATLSRSGTGGVYTYTVTTNSQYIYTFDGSGKLLTIRDPFTQTTQLDYSSGKLAHIVDASNHFTLALSYNGDGLLQYVTDTVNSRVATYSYTSGDLTGITDMSGLSWTYVYSGATHLLWKVIDPAGHLVIETRYNSSGQATQQYDGLGNLIAQVNYAPANANNRDIGQIDPQTGTLVTSTVTFDHGVPISTTNPLGNSSSTAFNQVLSPGLVTDARGARTTATYSGNLPAGVTDALGHSWQVAYSDLNYPTIITDAVGFTSTNTYSGTLLTRSTDSKGNTTVYTYTTAADAPEPANHVRFQQDARGAVTRYQYNAQGQVLTTTVNYVSPGTFDPDHPDQNLQTTYTYDSQGRQLTISDPAGRVNRTDYDPTTGWVLTSTQNYLAGHPKNYLSDYNLVAEYAYDAVGNRTIMTDTLGHATRTQYDAVNRPVTVTTNYVDGVFSSAHPDEDIQQVTGYDPNGNVVTSTEFANVPGLARKTVTAYDALNRPVTVTMNYVDGVYSAAHPDEDVQQVTGYDANGNVVTRTEFANVPGLARKTVTAYDSLNRPVTVTTNYVDGVFSAARPDEDIQQVTGYDGNGNVVTTTVAANVPGLARKTVTAYDSLNRPVTVTTNYVDGVFSSAHPDEDIQSVSQYDANGNVLTTTQFAGVSGLERKTVTAFDALNQPVTVTTNYVSGSFHSGHPDQDIPSVTQYDALGRVITTTQYAGISGLERRTYTQYDLLNRPVTVTTNYVSGTFDTAHPDQDIPTLTQYDALGRVITTTQYAGISGLERKTYTQYDGAGRAVTVTANYVDGSFDADHPDQDVQAITQYDAAGDVLTRTAFANVPGLARATVTQYDNLGRAITVTQNFVGSGVFDPSAPDQNIQQVTLYDGAGNVSATIEYRGGPGLATVPITTSYAYDRLGQTITTTTPLTGSEVAHTVLSYDGLGQVVTQTDALGRKTVTQYDELGRPLTVTANYVDGVFSGGTPDEDLQTVTTYNAAGERLKVRDPKSVTTQFQYDLLGQMTVVTDALTGTTRYAFDAAGQVITITDALTHSTIMAYDLLGRETRQADALGHTSVYTYDAAGNRTQMTDANGLTTVYTYNLNNQLTNIDYPAGTADVAFAFDGAGQRTVMTDGLGTTTWTYDQMGRPITVTDPFSASVGYVYDSAGNRLTLTYPDCRVAHYTYDLASRLTAVSSLCQDSATNTYSYDAAGRLITTTLANGVVSVYGYDNADRLHTLTHSQFGWTLGAYTYTVDASGNRTGVVESLQAPDSLPGTITTTVISYTYDALYRLTEANYSTGDVFTYTYDAVGNHKAQGGPDGTSTYAYDDANRLITLDGTLTYTWDNNGNLMQDVAGAVYTYDAANRLTILSNPTSDFSNTYRYDGLGNRLAQWATGLAITYTNDTTGDLTQVLVQTDDTGATTYLYGVARIAQQSAASTDYFLDDGLGSVRQLADASGDVTLEKAYDPYGHPLSTLGSGSTRFDFAGEYKDPSALIYLRARYYTSRRGRFIQADSWAGNYENPGTLNRFVYGLNAPTLLTDPSGNVCVVGFDVFPGLVNWCTDADRQAGPAFAQIIHNEQRFNEGFSIELLDTLALGIPGILGQLSDNQISQLTKSIPWLTTQLILNSCGLKTGQPAPWYGPLINNPDPFFQAGRMVGRGSSLVLAGGEVIGGTGGAAASLALEFPSFGISSFALVGSTALVGHALAVGTVVVVKEISDPLLSQAGIIIARAVAASDPGNNSNAGTKWSDASGHVNTPIDTQALEHADEAGIERLLAGKGAIRSTARDGGPLWEFEANGETWQIRLHKTSSQYAPPGDPGALGGTIKFGLRVAAGTGSTPPTADVLASEADFIRAYGIPSDNLKPNNATTEYVDLFGYVYIDANGKVRGLYTAATHIPAAGNPWQP